MDETAIHEVNNLLGLVDTYLLTESEIEYLIKIGENPTSECEYYATTQIVLLERSKFDPTMQASLDALGALAALDGCTLEEQEAETPSVDIPVYGGSIP